MNEKLRATPSKFDSDLFGHSVGRLEAQGVVSVPLVREENKGLFDVVFVRTTGWQEPHWGNPVALDWRYDMELLNGATKGVGEPEVRALREPSQEHLSIASSAFADSRFLRDPLCAKKAPELYQIWLKTAPSLWALVGAHENDAFLVQTWDEDGFARISLIGVGEAHRGIGVGDRLALGVMAQLPDVKGWRVLATVRNWRAIRFYEGLGFRVKELTTAFHVWM